MTDLQELLDRERVIELVNDLFVAVDRRDWPRAAACFADRVRFDMTSAGAPGPADLTPAEIVGGWQSGLAPIQAVHHQSGNFRVRVTGDSAECFCYATAHHFRPVQSGNNTRIFVGSYDYRLSRSGGEWRMTHFTFHLKFVDGNLALDREDPA